MRVSAFVASMSVAIAALVPAACPAGADTVPAMGSFTMTTAPGILPAWSASNITIIGVAPASVTTSRFSSDATITMPLVAKNGTANASAGGFRVTNTESGDSFRCLIPVVDTRARVIDCLTDAGYNLTVFSIEEIDDRQTLTTSSTRTTIFEGMEIRLTASGASMLNRELDTTVFSTSVAVADGTLLVRRAR